MPAHIALPLAVQVMIHWQIGSQFQLNWLQVHGGYKRRPSPQAHNGPCQINAILPSLLAKP